MKRDNPVLAEVQEVTLWQQLNRQLMETTQGRLDDTFFRHLKQFCLDNLLFSRISGARLLDEIPLKLMTNLSDISFITLKEDGWNRELGRMLRETGQHHNVFELDIDEALADATDVVNQYDERHHLTDQGGEDSPDDELSEFIDEYLDLDESFSDDFSSIVYNLNAMKLDFLRSVAAEVPVNYGLEKPGGRLFLVLADPTKIRVIRRMFKESFVPSLEGYENPISRRLDRLKNLSRYLSEQKSQTRCGSIQRFIDEEGSLLQNEDKVLSRLQSQLSRVTHYKRINVNRLTVCSTSPFRFLKYPFPEILSLRASHAASR